MKARYSYPLLFLLPSAMIAFLAAFIVAAAGAGTLWIFVYGDSPWPESADTALMILAVTVSVLTFTALAALSYSFGKNQETRGGLRRSHMVSSLGVSIGLPIHHCRRRYRYGMTRALCLSGLIKKIYLKKTNQFHLHHGDNFMHHAKLALTASISLLCIACASPSRDAEPAKEAQASAGKAQVVKSRDGKFTGEIVGKPAASSKFAKLQIGMQMNEVQDVMGRAPDRLHTYESGKRWIPFYFGNDARRMQVFYKNEGCLIFTDGNVWGGAGGDLVQIEADPSGKCYQP